MLPDLKWRTRLGDPSVTHHHDPVGEREGLALVVRDGEHGRSQLAEEFPEFDDQPFAQRAVQLAERFVEHQQAGAGRQGTGECDALLLAAGEEATARP